MRAFAVALQGGLAGVALLAAYFTWQRPPEKAAAEVDLLSVRKADLEEVRFQGPKGTLRLWRENGELWMHHQGVPVLDGDGGVLSAAPPAKTLKASEAALRTYERFSPFRATRALGALEDAALAEVGLAKPERTLVVRASGAQTSFDVGTSGGGYGSGYARQRGQKEVYLLPSGLLGELESDPERLFDRRLHLFKLDEVQSLRVAAADKERLLRQKQGQWFFADKPEEASEQARNWHDKLWRPPVVYAFGQGEAADAGSPRASLRLEYLAEDGQLLGWAEYFATPGGPFVRTEHTANLARLAPLTQAAVDEASRVIVK